MNTNYTSKITEGSIYDVSTYSDRDLYNILDLDNPTDRELEAKILSMVNKYTRMRGNLSSDMLAQFFIDIYARFFELPDDESRSEYEEDENETDPDTDTEYEGFIDYGETMNLQANNVNVPTEPGVDVISQQANARYTTPPPPGNQWSNYERNDAYGTITNEIQKGNQYGQSEMTRNVNRVNFIGNVDTRDAVGNVLTESQINEQPRITQSFNTQKVNRLGTLDITKNGRGDNPTQLTKPIDYTTDYINPLLKQTIKRVISIDSQYRDNKKASSTEFTFNLSEPLKDVVSLKLYSVQIPYTWYTINSSFGGNFFYIKGDVEGIDNGNHDYKIEIPSGNYTSSSLIGAIQSSITALRNVTPQVDFGSTDISYENSTVQTTLNIDIKESFGESNYYLEFPNWSSPIDNTVRANTLAGYMGFNTTAYNCFSIYSDRTILTSQLQSDSAQTISIDGSNNTILFVNYISNNSKYEYQVVPDETHIHDSSYSIVITNGSYNIYELLREINYQITQNTAFDQEYSNIHSMDIDSTNNVQNAGFSYIQMDIKFKREILQNKENLKTAILFPSTVNNTVNIWRESLKFSNTTGIYETSYIQSETKIAQSKYVIQRGVLGNTGIKFLCNVPGYIDSTNNIEIYLSNSSNLGYTLDEYIGEINRTITNYTDPSNNKSITGTKIEKTADHFLKIIPVINVSFTNKDYRIKIEGRNLPQILCNVPKERDDNSVTTVIYNLSEIHEWTIEFNRVYTTQIDTTDKISIIPIFPYGAHNPGYTPQTFEIQFYQTTTGIPFITFTSVATLVEYLNSAFINYKDAQESNPFRNGASYTSLTQIDAFSYTFTVGINKSFITDDYILSLYGEQKETETSPTINPWVAYLDFSGNYSAESSSSPYNQLYLLKNTTPGIMTHSILNNSSIRNNQITLTNENNYFYIKSYSTIDGLTRNGNGLYDIKITIPVENESQIYTIEDIYSITNSLLNTGFNGIARGSTVGKDSNGYTVFKININKVFRTNDYRLVFYDPYSFVSCYSGATRRGAQSVQNATWDTTVGWVLGFREQIIYYLNDPQYTYRMVNGNPVYTLQGDTTVSTSLYNYFLIVLDDYTQNHLNDGLVTITPQETSIDVGPYKYVCDPYSTNGNGNQIAVPADRDYTTMSQRDLYAFNQKIQSKKVKEKSYSKGPFVKDIFGIIPIKTSGLLPGSTYVEFGGTLQNQERMYFGPVNIHRMTIRLLNDRGDLVDLNNANWSFSLVCEQLYKQTTA